MRCKMNIEKSAIFYLQLSIFLCDYSVRGREKVDHKTVGDDNRKFGDDYIANGIEESKINQKPGNGIAKEDYGDDIVSGREIFDYIEKGHKKGKSKILHKYGRNMGEGKSMRKEKFDPSGLPLDDKLGMQLAFLVNMDSGCSGTLIHQDWIISATHCFPDEYAEASEDEKGDKVLKINYEMQIPSKTSSRGLKKDQYWAKPIIYEKKQSDKEGEDVNSAWASIDKFVFDKAFVDEARSWKGGDVALIHLKPGRNMGKQKGVILPMCLPDKTFKETGPETGKTYMAGFGRRRLAHCMTNGEGPEKFAVCGRPVDCSKNHRATKCGLSFQYQNKLHHECLKKTPTPSKQNKICQKVLKSIGRDDFNETNYIFEEEGKDELVLKTICYRTQVRSGQKGWCTVRDPMHDKNVEPKTDSGWGFCSDDEDQKDCNDIIEEVTDKSAYEIEIMDDKWCLDEMFLNLQREQPEVTYEEIEPFPRLYCAGHKPKLDVAKYYCLKKSGAVEIDLKAHKKKIREALVKSKKVKDAIDGGPACFGDSGGPMWKNYLDSDGITKPVQLGVYSFMLWGTCRGRHEPSYYGRVTDYLDFIYRHIPKDELCTVGASKH